MNMYAKLTYSKNNLASILKYVLETTHVIASNRKVLHLRPDPTGPVQHPRTVWVIYATKHEAVRKRLRKVLKLRDKKVSPEEETQHTKVTHE